jgi:hypothetical protein
VEKDIRTSPVSEPLAPQADPEVPPGAARESAPAPVEPPMNTAALILPVVDRVKQRRARIADLHAKHPDAYQPPSKDRYPHASLFRIEGQPFIVHLWVQGGSYLAGSGDTPRVAYAAAWRELRLAKHDRAALLRQNAELRAGMDMLANDLTNAAVDIISMRLDKQTARDQRQRALLTARRRGPKISKFRSGFVPTLVPDPAVIDLRAGLDRIRVALNLAGHNAGPLDQRIRNLIAERDYARADRDRWRKQAEVSATSYRQLASRISAELQDKTAEISPAAAAGGNPPCS